MAKITPSGKWLKNLIAGIILGTVVYFIMYSAHFTGPHH